MGGFVSVAADGGIEDILARKNVRGLDVKQTQTEEDEKEVGQPSILQSITKRACL